MRMSYSFELRPEHLKLLPELAFEVRFDTVYGDEVVPAINPKRPFGNSAVTYDVCRRLRFNRDADGEFSRDDELRAMHIIAAAVRRLAWRLSKCLWNNGIRWELIEIRENPEKCAEMSGFSA